MLTPNSVRGRVVIIVIFLFFAVAFVVLFLFFLGWLLSKEDIGSRRLIRSGCVGAFWTFSAHAQMVRLHPVCKRSDNGRRTQRQELARRLIGGSSTACGALSQPRH